MRTPIPDYLDQLLRECPSVEGGALDEPDPAPGHRDRLAVCLTTPDGVTYAAGDCDVEFPMQSISKAFVYGLALQDQGLEEVLRKIDVEPSGDAFNELSLDPDTHRPRNPMINAGAITAHSLVRGRGQRDRSRRILNMLGRVAGRELRVDRPTLEREKRTGWRNRALGYMLRQVDVLEGDDPQQTVDGYLEQCSVLVTARDLSMMAATLANNGRSPVTHRQVLGERAVRQVLSVMLTCGMYDSAGDWVSSVGIPAKSGVAGAIIGVLPGQVGVAAYSPPLDKHGNSIRGIGIFERLSHDMGMHIMSGHPERRSVLREIDAREPVGGDRSLTVVELQGYVQFNGAELVLRGLSQEEITTDTVVLDMHDVQGADEIARRMLREGMRRLLEEGREVVLVDPGATLEEPRPGRRPRVEGRLTVGASGEQVRRVRRLEDV